MANICKKGLDPSGSHLKSGDLREFQNYRTDCSVHSAQSQISVSKVWYRGFSSRLLQVSVAVLKVTVFAISRPAGRSRSQPSQEVKCPNLSLRSAFYLDYSVPISCLSVWTNCFLYVYISVYLYLCLDLSIDIFFALSLYHFGSHAASPGAAVIHMLLQSLQTPILLVLLFLAMLTCLPLRC